MVSILSEHRLQESREPWNILLKYYSTRKMQIPERNFSGSMKYKIAWTSGDGCSIMILDRDTGYFGRELVLPGRYIGDHGYHVEQSRMTWYYPDHKEMIDDLLRSQLINLIKEGELEHDKVFTFLDTIEEKKEMSIYSMTREIFDDEAPILIIPGHHWATVIFGTDTEFPRMRLHANGEANMVSPSYWTNCPHPLSAEEEYRALDLIDREIARKEYDLIWWL